MTCLFVSNSEQVVLGQAAETSRNGQRRAVYGLGDGLFAVWDTLPPDTGYLLVAAFRNGEIEEAPQ